MIFVLLVSDWESLKQYFLKKKNVFAVVGFHDIMSGLISDV
jgi:hypothetical protein